MLKVTKRGVAKQGADCRKSGIASTHGVPAVLLEMVEKGPDVLSVKVVDVYLGRFDSLSLGREL